MIALGLAELQDYHRTVSSKSVMLQLSDAQLERLDAEAKRLGVSRSKVVRDCVDQSFAERFDARVAELYATAYATNDEDIDEWGSLDEWHAAAARSRAADARDPW